RCGGCSRFLARTTACRTMGARCEAGGTPWPTSTSSWLAERPSSRRERPRAFRHRWRQTKTAEHAEHAENFECFSANSANSAVNVCWIGSECSVVRLLETRETG